MKSTRPFRLTTSIASLLPLATSLVLAATTSSSHAADGTWATDANGNWSDSTKWVGGTIADGATFTANFVVDLTAARTVTNDTPRTIGNINFDDTGAAGDVTWNLAGTAANPLTLDNGGAGTTSTISASQTINFGNSFVISAVLAGPSNVLFNHTVNGTGARRQLAVTNAANTYTGTTIIQNGFLGVGSGNSILAAGSPLGISSAAIILGNTNTTANTAGGGTAANLGIDLTATAGVPNLTIDRNIDSSTSNDSLGRTLLNFMGPTGATGTLTVSSNWTLGAGSVRAYGITIAQAGQTVDYTGAITGGGTSSFRVGDFGTGLGTLRLANAANSFTNQITVEKGRVLIANNAAAGAVDGALGRGAALTLGGNGVTAAGDVITALTDGAFNVGKTISLNTNGGNVSTLVFTHVLGGNQAVASTFSGAVNTASVATNRGLNLTQVAGGTTTFSGVIGANANATGVTNVDKIGAGTVALGAAAGNTYDGVTRVLGGTLLANNATGSATGAGTVSVGVVSPALTGQTGNTQNISTSTALTARQINNISNATAATLQLGQAVSGTGITAGSTITGIAIGVGAGTSSITISTTFSVPASMTTSFTDLAFGTVATATGTLGGVGGAISGAITVNAGSTIAPGDASTLGTLNAASSVTFGAGSTFDIQTGVAAATDRLSVTGLLDLSGVENLVASGAFNGSNYLIATYGTLSGTFDNVSGLGAGYFVDYSTPGSIFLSVPEPSAAISLLGGLGMLVGLGRRRRK